MVSLTRPRYGAVDIIAKDLVEKRAPMWSHFRQMKSVAEQHAAVVEERRDWSSIDNVTWMPQGNRIDTSTLWCFACGRRGHHTRNHPGQTPGMSQYVADINYPTDLTLDIPEAGAEQFNPLPRRAVALPAKRRNRQTANQATIDHVKTMDTSVQLDDVLEEHLGVDTNALRQEAATAADAAARNREDDGAAGDELEDDEDEDDENSLASETEYGGRKRYARRKRGKQLKDMGLPKMWTKQERAEDVWNKQEGTENVIFPEEWTDYTD